MNIQKGAARVCNSCPLGRYARSKPDNLLRKVIRWHGVWWPVWRAWEKEYGENVQDK